jgi:acetyl-CoA acyltransferase
MGDPVIVDALRTPVAKKDEALEDVRSDMLGAYLVKGLVKKAGIDPEDIDDVIMGCVDQVGEQAMNVARNVVIASGLPIEVPATTVDRQCGSSQTALNLAATKVQAGVDDVVLSGGVESMTRVPMGGNMDVHGDPFSQWWQDRYDPVPQGISAEMIASEWDISREALDEFSYGSHEKASRAIREDRFDRETLPVPVDELAEPVDVDDVTYTYDVDDPESDWLVDDEGVRMEPDLDAMKGLDPVFQDDGVVTAGNSSQMSDGASAVLVMSEEKASAEGLEPRARIVGQEIVGVNPTMMLTGPIPSTRQLLDDAGMTIDDVDVIEINEAFASVVLAWEKELDPDMEKVNVNGGAIALGHPLGATGGKLMTTLLHELERQDERFGLQTMCCGGGLGVATLIDRNV